MRVTKHSLCCLAVVIATTVVPVCANSGAGIAAITNPSADRALSFVQPGRIAEVHFKEGDAVKA